MLTPGLSELKRRAVYVVFSRKDIRIRVETQKWRPRPGAHKLAVEKNTGRSLSGPPKRAAYGRCHRGQLPTRGIASQCSTRAHLSRAIEASVTGLESGINNAQLQTGAG
jgi:hypothetical protein